MPDLATVRKAVEAPGPTPAAIVSGLTFAHISLQDWVYILTIIFTCLQIGSWVWSKYKHWRRNHGSERK